MILLLLDDLSLTRQKHGYQLQMRSGEYKTVQPADRNLGLFMSAVSAAVNDIYHQATEFSGIVSTELRESTVNLKTITLEDCTVYPYWKTLTMTAGQFSYTARMDRNLEHVALAFMGALKFFSFKFGVISLDAEVARNRDRAGEAGLLTKEDFPS